MPDLHVINNFLQAVNGAPFFIFGFTYIIWRHFIQQLSLQNISFDFTNALMIHGGGRKNLNEELITGEQFRKSLHQYTGLQKIHNYYGMVEQTGSIFLECDYQRLHCSAFSDILSEDLLTSHSANMENMVLYRPYRYYHAPTPAIISSPRTKVYCWEKMIAPVDVAVSILKL